MQNNSFLYGDIDMREAYGLIVERYADVLAPELRQRKQEVPERDGAFDYGAAYYNERELSVECGTVQLLTREACRELSATLGRKAKITFWNEPDKYYIGRIYDPATIERLAGKMKKFTLTFVCDPFAYGQQRTEAFEGSANLSYAGSARTPTRITVTNTTGVALQGLTITMREAILT